MTLSLWYAALGIYSKLWWFIAVRYSICLEKSGHLPKQHLQVCYTGNVPEHLETKGRGPFRGTDTQGLRRFSGTRRAELIQDQKERQSRIKIEDGRPKSGLQKCFVWPAEYFQRSGAVGSILKLEIRHKAWFPLLSLKHRKIRPHEPELCLGTISRSREATSGEAWALTSARPSPDLLPSFLTSARPRLLELTSLAGRNGIFHRGTLSEQIA